MYARVKKKPKNKTIPVFGTIYNTLGDWYMKITKRQLKKIIKEELENMLDEQRLGPETSRAFNPFEGYGTGERLKDVAYASPKPGSFTGKLQYDPVYDEAITAGEEGLGQDPDRPMRGAWSPETIGPYTTPPDPEAPFIGAPVTKGKIEREAESPFRQMQVPAHPGKR